MKLLLKEFQIEAVDRLVNRLRRASEEAEIGELQSVSLSSPTGSGKTIMITAAIERLLEGDAENDPTPDATFLWVTDQPELNEQTRRKMLDASSVLGLTDLIVIDGSFDQETFSPGNIYFLNIQKLGRERYLVTPGDSRSFTIWETITNTVDTRPGAFYVLIDEAHRGMSESATARNEAATIIQKFIKGSTGEIPPIPIIAGISATPERFNRLIEGTARTSRPVTIDPEDVRASGLLKEILTVYHPSEDQPSDMTMLRAAARSWRDYSRDWFTYCENQGEPAVRPILVVQVQDASGRQISKTDLAEAIQVLNEELGPLPTSALAHAFQEGGRINAGDHELRYLAPSNIDQDPDVQVVFFKTSLNTGWDCPRAEVMMSFRTAVDATLIAQLVGRMVRTPLARRIDSNEHLNTVALYLPHYDEKGLEKVVSQLSSRDPNILPPVDVERGEDIAVLNRAIGHEGAFAALAELPSYVIPRHRKTSQVRRLMKLARLLANDDIEPDAVDTARDGLLATLRHEYERMRKTEPFQRIVEESGKLDVRGVSIRLGSSVANELGQQQLDIASENVDDLFDEAGRKLGEGLHKAWWRTRVEEDPSARVTGKLELFALCNDPEVLRKVESIAQEVVQKWLRTYKSSIDCLPEARHQSYDEIRRLARRPEQTPLDYPDTIEVRVADTKWRRNLYVDDASLFPSKLNKWEAMVIEEEIDRADVVAWLRNPDRKSWSVCVPYELGGVYHPMYPDFLVVRSEPGGLVVDLLDPHLIELEDAPAKAAGLAQYAAEHWHRFGRIQLIIVDDNRVKRLDLTDERVRDDVKGVKTHEHLRHLFSNV